MYSLNLLIKCATFRQAMQHRFQPPLKENNRVQVLLLSPLVELCGIPYPDVRQKQLDTVLHILHR